MCELILLFPRIQDVERASANTPMSEARVLIISLKIGRIRACRVVEFLNFFSKLIQCKSETVYHDLRSPI